MLPNRTFSYQMSQYWSRALGNSSTVFTSFLLV
jgi:hypothetical protein